MTPARNLFLLLPINSALIDQCLDLESLRLELNAN